MSTLDVELLSPHRAEDLLPPMWRHIGVLSKERAESQILIFASVHTDC